MKETEMVMAFVFGIFISVLYCVIEKKGSLHFTSQPY